MKVLTTTQMQNSCTHNIKIYSMRTLSKKTQVSHTKVTVTFQTENNNQNIHLKKPFKNKVLIDRISDIICMHVINFQ